MYNNKILKASEYVLPKTDEKAPYDLMMNENLQEPSPLVKETIKHFEIKDCQVYHRDNNAVQRNLATSLIDYFDKYCGGNITKENFLVTNGSDIALDLIIKTFCNDSDTISVITPTYTNMELKALMHCKLERILHDHLVDDLSLHVYNGKMIYIVNPNMPFGYVCYQKIYEIIEKYPNKIIIVDEAYAELSDAKSFIPFINNYPNLIVIRSMSKGFGLPGIRIGYCIFNKIHLPQLLKSYCIRNLTISSVKIATAALNSLDFYQNNWKMIKKEYINIKYRLSTITAVNREIYHYDMGDAPFYFIYTYNTKRLCEYLYNKGFIVRDKHSEIPNSIRVSVSTSIINNLFLDELLLYNLTINKRNNYIDLDGTLRKDSFSNKTYDQSTNIVKKLKATILTNNASYLPHDLVSQVSLNNVRIITPLTTIKKIITENKYVPYVVGSNQVKKYLNHTTTDISMYNMIVITSNIFNENITEISKVTFLIEKIKQVYVYELMLYCYTDECNNSNNKYNVLVPSNGIFIKSIMENYPDIKIFDYGKNTFQDKNMGLMIGDTIETDGDVCFRNNGLFVCVLNNENSLTFNGKYFEVGNIDILYPHIK